MISYCLYIYKCASSIILSYSICYITFVYTVDMLKVWPSLICYNWPPYWWVYHCVCLLYTLCTLFNYYIYIITTLYTYVHNAHSRNLTASNILYLYNRSALSHLWSLKNSLFGSQSSFWQMIMKFSLQFINISHVANILVHSHVWPLMNSLFGRHICSPQMPIEDLLHAMKIFHWKCTYICIYMKYWCPWGVKLTASNILHQ